MENGVLDQIVLILFINKEIVKFYNVNVDNNFVLIVVMYYIQINHVKIILIKFLLKL